MKPKKQIAISLLLIAILISCGKNKKLDSKDSTATNARQEAFLNSKYIQALCQSEDNSSHDDSIEIYIASPQEDPLQFSAYISQAPLNTESSAQSVLVNNLTSVKTESILTYTSENYSLEIELLNKLAPYKVKGTVQYFSDGQLEQRDLSCVVDDLE